MRSLASTTRKFFFWFSLMCPMPARSSPVIESFEGQPEYLFHDIRQYLIADDRQ
jgi:hypothetical protein